MRTSPTEAKRKSFMPGVCGLVGGKSALSVARRLVEKGNCFQLCIYCYLNVSDDRGTAEMAQR